MSETLHIARISHGKDSLKMLDVIVTRGLPLDRITTTDVWATDTIRAELPEVVEAKDRIDEYIWKKYRIEVEHLCARNPDGTKRTYEQMFYHVPVRRSQSVQVEREREREGAGRERSSASRTSGIRGARSSNLCQMRHQGFPAQISPWCRKLKIDKVRTPFSIARHDGRKEISWNTWESPQTNRNALGSSMKRSALRWWSSA